MTNYVASVEDLTEDGDTVKLSTGITVKLTVEPDHVSPSEYINDADVWGKVSKYCYSYLHGESRTPRPEDFDGAARKIEVAQGYWVWWQPAEWWKDLTPEQQRAEQDAVTDLLQGGFSVVSLIAFGVAVDAYGGKHTVELARSVACGVDYLRSDHVAGHVADLWTELKFDLR